MPALSASRKFQPPAAERRLAYSPAAKPSATDIEALTEAIRSARRGKAGTAADIRNQIHDGSGRKLVEWVILRSDDDATNFARYAAFIRANPSWPSLNLFRRRAEARLSCFPSSPTSIATRLAC